MAESWPEQSLYPSPRAAMRAPAETTAYVSLHNPSPDGRPDMVAVVDTDPASKNFGRIVGRVEMPHAGDELHHVGWTVTSSALCPYAPRHLRERRYLIALGFRSSRIYILDTQPDPRAPHVARVIEPDVVADLTGYSRPRTAHAGPDGICVSALGSPDGDGPGGLFLLDPESFDLIGPWEIDRGPQYLSGDLAWHLGHETTLTSEWGPADTVAAGFEPARLRAGGYGHALHVWDRRRRGHVQRLDLGPDAQMVLALRPAHDPRRTYGFAAAALSRADLAGSVWLWYRNGDRAPGWNVRRVIDIPAVRALPEALPAGFGGLEALPPLVTHVNLSLDDRFLYVSCWASGEVRQYDVANPFQPTLIGAIRLGGALRGCNGSGPFRGLRGGPATTEISRDGRRLYVTNSFCGAWDAQAYPRFRGWLAAIDVDHAGGMQPDPRFVVDFGDLHPHRTTLEGGDASSDAFCFA